MADDSVVPRHAAQQPQQPQQAPPGWYPDRAAPGLERWWDGAAWTQHARPVPYAPQPVVMPLVQVSQGVNVSVRGGVNHGLHLMLTVLTCGAWLPVWIGVVIFDALRGPARF